MQAETGPSLIGVDSKPDRFHRSTPLRKSLRDTRRYSLVRRLGPLIVILIVTFGGASIWLLSGFLEQNVLRRDAETLGQLLNGIVQVEQATNFFMSGDQNDENVDLEELLEHLAHLPKTLRANIYSLDRRVIWSSDPALIGRQFTDNEELKEAFRGETVVESGIVTVYESKEEHAALAKVGDHFAENYIPIYQLPPNDHLVAGVVEVYRTPDRLFESIQASTNTVWLGAIIGGTALCAILVVMLWHAAGLVERQSAALVEAEKLATVGEMAAAVAHGLRNPLASIRSSAELAADSPPEEVTTLLADIVVCIDRLEGWIKQYLATTRDGGSTTIPADPRAVLATSIGHYRAKMDQCRIRLVIDAERDLPTVTIHPVMFGQLVNGLLANAIEAMGQGGTITVQANRAGQGRVRIAVIDDGPGMTPLEAERALEPFVTTKSGGLGLGLPLTREMLERQGGRLQIESQRGVGTKVTMELPVAPSGRR